MANRYSARIRRVLDFHGGASKRAKVGDREAKQADVATQLDIARCERKAALMLRERAARYPGEAKSLLASAELAERSAAAGELEALATIEREGLR